MFRIILHELLKIMPLSDLRGIQLNVIYASRVEQFLQFNIS